MVVCGGACFAHRCKFVERVLNGLSECAPEGFTGASSVPPRNGSRSGLEIARYSRSNATLYAVEIEILAAARDETPKRR